MKHQHVFTIVCKGREPLSSDTGIKFKKRATLLSIEPQPLDHRVSNPNHWTTQYQTPIVGQRALVTAQ